MESRDRSAKNLRGGSGVPPPPQLNRIASRMFNRAPGGIAFLDEVCNLTAVVELHGRS